MDAYRSNSAGTPLLLLHGLTGSWPIWRPILPALAAEHRVFAPTLPGHHGGASLPAGQPPSTETLADMLEAQLDAEGIQRAHLVGNSLGGWLALTLSRRGRALSVVALSPAGAWETAADVRRVVRLIGNTVRATRRFSRLAKHLAQYPRVRRLLLRQIMERGERLDPAATCELLDAAIGCTLVMDFLAQVPSAPRFVHSEKPAEHPIRIAWAEFDRTIPFQRYGRPLVAAVPGCELVHLPGVGHVPMYDNPELVTRTILGVTRAVDAKTPAPQGNDA